MTSRPSLDVVVPVRSGARFLPAAVASALAQDADVLVTVVDDGAPDDVAALLADAPPERVRIVPNARRPGIGGARNTGAAAGTRPLLAFLDADDVWPAGRTADLLALLGESAGHVLAFGMAEQFRDVTTTTAVELPEPPRPGMLAGGLLLRRTTWERVGEFDEQLPIGEFIDWVARARAAGAVERLTDRVVLRRRIHDDNTTLHRRAEQVAYADVVRRHLHRRDAR